MASNFYHMEYYKPLFFTAVSLIYLSFGFRVFRLRCLATR